MKTMLTFLAAAGLAGAAFAAEPWTKPQQEVADVFKAWAQTEKAHDLETQMNLLATGFTAWEYSRPSPMDREAYRQMSLDLFQRGKVTDCVIQPTLIQVEGSAAVAHGRFAEKVRDAAGQVSHLGGPWTASLIRVEGKWLMLTLAWTNEPDPASQATEEEVVQLEHAWARAYLDRDLATLDRLEAEEWVCTTADGERFNKAEDIDSVKSGDYQATEFKMDEVKARVFGDTAVATAIQTEKATYKGKDASKVLRCTDTWIRRDGRWQCVATHLSYAAKK